MKKAVFPGIKNRWCFHTVFPFFLVLLACNGTNQKEADNRSSEKQVQLVNVPVFNADSAYHFTEKQTSFGPRVPNTEAHVKCGDYFIETMKGYADTVYVQSAIVNSFDGKALRIRNIICSYNPQNQNRVILCAHWDSRPFADQDSVDQDKPILAANDGAASCAVLMEIGRILKTSKPLVGIDIIFFDAEDYGQPDNSTLPRQDDSYCLGSQYWARKPHIERYSASYGILLDMVGAENATFTKEGTSMQYASSVVNKVWEHANRIGYSDYFLFRETAAIIDDHYYINRIAHIPVIDIVHRDPGTPSNFWKHWHTHQDTMDKISKKSLKAAGQTVLETIFREGTAN